MKAAFTVGQERIAPVFDVTGTALVVESDGLKILSREGVLLPDGSAEVKVDRLVGLGVEHLICGAISRPVQLSASKQGIVIHPFVSGRIEEILSAWLEGSLDDSNYRMPGCGRQGRRRCRRRKV